MLPLNCTHRICNECIWQKTCLRPTVPLMLLLGEFGHWTPQKMQTIFNKFAQNNNTKKKNNVCTRNLNCKNGWPNRSSIFLSCFVCVFSLFFFFLSLSNKTVIWRFPNSTRYRNLNVFSFRNRIANGNRDFNYLTEFNPNGTKNWKLLFMIYFFRFCFVLLELQRKIVARLQLCATRTKQNSK